MVHLKERLKLIQTGYPSPVLCALIHLQNDFLDLYTSTPAHVHTYVETL